MITDDERVEEAFASTYASVVATAPIPLEWDEILDRPTSLEPLPREGLLTPALAFVSAAIVILAAIAAVALLRANDGAHVAADATGWKAILFVSDDASRAEIDAIAEGLQGLDGVTGWLYVDRELALEEALAMFGDDARMTQIILEDPSIIPSSLRFATVDEASAQAVLRVAEAESAITDGTVVYGPMVATEPGDFDEQGAD